MKFSIVAPRPGIRSWCVILAAAWLVGDGAVALGQFRARRQDLPDLDSRTAVTLKAGRLAERQAAQSQLRSRLPSVVVDFDPLLDSPTFVRSYGGFLTGPEGQGGAVSAATLKALPESDSLRPLKAFLNEHSALFGYGADMLNSARVRRDYRDAHNGLRTIAWQQQLDGVAVFQAVLVAHVTRNGELTSLSSRFLPDLAAAADAGTPGRAGFQSSPAVAAGDAIRLALANIGADVAAAKLFPAGSSGDYLLYKTPEQASTRLVWFPLDRSTLRLAWEALVTKPATHESFQLIVDAQTGEILLRKNLTCHISDATYSVYDSYSPSPMAPTLQTPGTYQPPLTNRNTITTPALDTTASPEGWIPDGANTTTGNNIDCFVDRNGDEQPDQPRPQGNPNRVFNFPLDLTQDPKSYIDGSIVQLFWRANWYHDRLYQLGFDEASGNFQDNNFGRGGLGNDHIICFVQAGADVGQTDNSMFAPAPDGQNGRCYMFTFTGTDPDRDGSLDSEVVVHEMTHGTSWRLVGGGGMVLGSLQGDGMGEGWSDFYAEGLLNPAGTDPDAAYAMGGYVTYLLAGMNQNYYFGIRRYPYSVDMTKNPLTFKDIDPGQALAHKGVPLSPLYSPFDPRMADEVHFQGEVWCVTLWEMHANLVHKHGWAVGNELALQLTTDGMKLTPPFPNFIQARDAIILADTIDNGGANLAEIWQAFAKRGMGLSATSPDGSTTAGVHEAYDIPIISTIGISVIATNLFGGNGNSIIDRNECNSLDLVLTNRGNVTMTGVSATLSTTTPEVAVARATVPYPNVPAGTAATNLISFKLSTSPVFVCGTPIELSLVVRCDQGVAFTQIVLPTGLPGTPIRYDNNTPVMIPSPGTNSSAIVVSNLNFAINKVTVSMYVLESFDYFLKLELIGPDGTTNLLTANNGLFGENYGLSCTDFQRTTFDDDATTLISAGVAPFAGSYKPEQALAVFTGKSGTNVNGVWQLRATESGFSDIASIQCWSLFITPTLCVDGGGECPGADLALGITAYPDPIIVGNNLTYTIGVTNNGPSRATNVAVTCLLPAGVLFVSAAPSQGTYSVAGGLVTFNLGAIGPQGRASMTVTVLPTAPGTIFTTATASSEQPDFVLENNAATVATRVSPATADLSVGLASAPNPGIVGSPVTYTVSLANNGPSPASGITVTNALPVNAGFLSATGSVGSFTVAANVVFWNLPGLSVGGRATATITVLPTTEGSFNATAMVGGAQFDPILGNNTATSATVIGPAADLGIGVTDHPDPVVAGSNLFYVVTVTNFGPSIATGVAVNEALPAGVSVFSATPTQGSVSVTNTALNWSVGTLSNGAQASITVGLRTTANGTLISTNTVIAAPADPNPANNVAVATTVVAAPFVSIVAATATLTAESFAPPDGTISSNETVTVILRLRNEGNVPTRANLVATLLTNSNVRPVPPNSQQTYGVLAPSGFAVGRPFSFTASGTNGETIYATLQLREDTTNYPSVSFSFTLPSAYRFANTNGILIPDPALLNPPWPVQAGPASPYPSTIAVSNLTGLLSRVTATLVNLDHTYSGDVNALLVAPDGARTLLMSHAGDQAAVAANLAFDDSAASPLPSNGALNSGTWKPTAYSPAPQLGGFPSNAPAGPYSSSLSVFSGVNPNGSWSLYVFDDAEGDAGGIANGWTLTLTVLTPVNQIADLRVTGVAAPSPCLAGGTLTYTFTVTNNGPNTATSVSFTNLLPAGVTLVSAAASQGLVLTNADSVVASLESLTTGTNATVTIVVNPTAAIIPPGATNATLINTASVAADQTDLTPGNNAVAVSSTINRPFADPGLTQTVVPDPLVVGYNLTNTVVVTNSGPQSALNTVVTQLLPSTAGLVWASSTVGTWTNTTGAFTCALGDLASNATATVTIVLTNAVAGLMTNRVSLTTDSFDLNTNNNSATYVTTVVNPAPAIIGAGARLTYESGPVNGMIDPGETVALALGLANVGTLDTANLKATLQASGGVTLPSGPQYYGTLIQGGPSVARSFSFKAAAALGGPVVASLQLQDEQPGHTTDLGTATFTFTLPSASAWSNTVAIAIPDRGIATPYPSSITVTGMVGRISKAKVFLNGLTHSFPHDVSVLLASPFGTNVLLMSHAGGGHAVTNLTLTFDDAAAAPLANYGAISSGPAKPSSYEGPVSLPGTAPYSSYRFVLSDLNWGTPNGTWSLYVYDDTTGDSGLIAGGWSLALTTAVTVGPVVDLGVSLSATAAIDLGANLTNGIVLTNRGPEAATDVVLTLTNPVSAGVSFVSASLSQGSVIGTGNGMVICSLGNLPVGSSATATIVTRPSVAGVLTGTALAVANEENLANNPAQAVTTVYGPAILSGAYTNDHFQLKVTGRPNVTYVVQGSTNFTSWVSLTTNTNATGTFTFTDTTTPTPRSRFYRTLRR